MSTSQRMLSSETTPKKNLNPVLICLALAILTVIPFGSLNNSGFINFDDDRYVTNNAYVQSGLNANSIGQAFTSELTKISGHWHPLTWLSLMLDYEIFGLNPQGFHLVNLLFHVLNTLLLFLILRRMTKTLWPSALVAALFAIHPLHVESVAWITNRKDVLSTFFWMLTMGAYSYYVENRGLRRYSLVLLFFVLGLMAKSILITLPFVLLLLDYWPLRRFGEIKPANSGNQCSLIYPLFWEKVPLFVLVILSIIITYIAAQSAGAVSLGLIPLVVRIGNAFISYIAYIEKMIWPINLAVFYPYPKLLIAWQVVGSVFLLIATTLVVIWKAKKFPYLATGWLWYLGTLVPVIGILQAGPQAMADRYTYIPLIGLFIMVAWGVPDLLKKWKYRKEVILILSILIILGLSIKTWTQVGYWQDSITLYDHTLKVTDDNGLIYNNRGVAFNDLGNYKQAIEDYSRAIAIKPDYADAYHNRGVAYKGLGNYTQAIEDYDEANRLKADSRQTYDDRRAIEDFNKASTLNYADPQKAIEYLNNAIKLKPNYADAYHLRGNNYATLKQYQRAIEDYNEAIHLNENYADAYQSRGVAYTSLLHDQSAIADFSKAISLKPDNADAYKCRGYIYFNQGNKKLGCSDAKKACNLGNCQLEEVAKNKGYCR